ncbi:MAG: aldo/keto reductase [Candidatus Gastranaerophilales bacterium]|nr:aldo/keto reductase [Candidatus Gastranaerophilales bacterium]
MKRREFIVNTALAVGGTALLTGCGKKELIKKEGQVYKRKFKDLEIPLLGFGCMRLPMTKNNEIDMLELDKMVDYSMEHGANYFDTAYMYVNGQSENAMGKTLNRYKREDFILADKSPIYKMRSQEDVRATFEEQCKKCGVEYFDFYMCHNINVNTVDIYKKVKMYDEIMKLKQEGRIKYVGFSFHGTPEILRDVVQEHKWDFCQLQINYLDWDVVKAHEQYEIVQEKKIPVIVMEPLRGGGLVNLSDRAMNKLKEAYPDTTPAEFGLRWAASRQNVITVLSGMSNLQQVKENVQTFMNYKDMDENEEKTADEIAKILQSQGEINCTACKYCMEVCPKNINIPAAFALYNQYKVTNNKMMFTIYYDTLAEAEKPEQCIKCGLCSKNCPQNLKIPELLTEISEEYKKIKA